eukprot:762830-Hanusia_phi.AAC.3
MARRPITVLRDGTARPRPAPPRPPPGHDRIRPDRTVTPLWPRGLRDSSDHRPAAPGGRLGRAAH